MRSALLAGSVPGSTVKLSKMYTLVCVCDELTHRSLVRRCYMKAITQSSGTTSHHKTEAAFWPINPIVAMINVLK